MPYLQLYWILVIGLHTVFGYVPVCESQICAAGCSMLESNGRMVCYDGRQGATIDSYDPPQITSIADSSSCCVLPAPGGVCVQVTRNSDQDKCPAGSTIPNLNKKPYMECCPSGPIYLNDKRTYNDDKRHIEYQPHQFTLTNSIMEHKMQGWGSKWSWDSFCACDNFVVDNWSGYGWGPCEAPCGHEGFQYRSCREGHFCDGSSRRSCRETCRPTKEPTTQRPTREPTSQPTPYPTSSTSQTQSGPGFQDQGVDQGVNHNMAFIIAGVAGGVVCVVALAVATYRFCKCCCKPTDNSYSEMSDNPTDEALLGYAMDNVSA